MLARKWWLLALALAACAQHTKIGDIPYDERFREPLRRLQNPFPRPVEPPRTATKGLVSTGHALGLPMPL